MKVTQWFKPKTKPVYVEYYQATAFRSYHCPPMCYWDGKQWWREDRLYEATFQDMREWRGLAEKPK